MQPAYRCAGIGYERDADMVPMTAAMMMRVGLISVSLHLVSVTVAMFERAGLGAIDARNALGRMRNRSQPKRQREHETEEQGG